MNNIFDANVCTMLKRDERQNVKIICFKMKKWNFCWDKLYCLENKVYLIIIWFDIVIWKMKWTNAETYFRDFKKLLI